MGTDEKDNSGSTATTEGSGSSSSSSGAGRSQSGSKSKSSRSTSRSRSSSSKSKSSSSGSSGGSSKTTKSESPTAARAQLDAREASPEGNTEEQLSEQAKRQEAQQAAELKLGEKLGKPTAALSEASVAEQRAGQLGAKPQFARVDNMTRRSDADPIEGHFVSIDLSNDAAKEAVEAVIGEGNARFGSGDYGVYLEPAQVNQETGYPETIMVQLRDEHAAFVTVPFEACSPALAGRR